MLKTDSQPLETRREADTSFFLTALRRNRPYLYLDLEFLTFSTVNYAFLLFMQTDLWKFVETALAN